jgi:two-component system nitrate/nitrite response regulator NarL
MAPARAGTRIRVVVADDHPLYREGVAGAIKQRPDLELVGEAEDGESAVELIRATQPDVALLDVKMDGDGMAVLRRLSGDDTRTRILFLSAYSASAVVYAALEAGAAGYLSKHSDRASICDSVRAVARGETVLSPETQTELAKEIRLQRDVDKPVLSTREREVLSLAAKGLKAPAIAERLFLSTATVKTHLAHAYGKLGASDRTTAVVEAMRRGLVE